jgi:hypothetical protein
MAQRVQFIFSMKITNAMLARYQELETQMEALSAELGALKNVLKEHGSCATKDFVVMVTEVSGSEYLVGLKQVEAVVGRKILEQNELIKMKAGYRKLTVEAKASRKKAA